MFSRVLACVLSACLVAAYLPLAAFADDDEETTQTLEGTVSCGNGWTLAYTATSEDGATWEASVTGPESTGSGTLSIPSTISLSNGSSATVTDLAEAAFKQCEELTAVTLPDTLVTLGKDALRQTSITTITIPASVAYIPMRCFWSCASLESIEFEGSTMEFLGYAAFRSCTSLESISVPALRGSTYIDERYTGDSGALSEWRIGTNCFAKCESLTLIVFEAGGDEYYLKAGLNQFDDSAGGALTLVSYVSHTNDKVFEKFNEHTGGTAYLALRYYASQEACEADEYGENAAYTALYQYGSTIYDDIYDAEASASYLYGTEGSLPTLASGMAWGVAERVMEGTTTTLVNTECIYPVQRENLDYGWVSCPAMIAAEGLEMNETSNYAIVYLSPEGIADLSDMKAYAADGTALDESLYELIYINTNSEGNFGNTVYTYEQVYAGEVWEAGDYMVYADGVEGTASEGTTTGTESSSSPTGKLGASFEVGAYTAAVTSYTGTDRSNALGRTELLTSSAISDAPTFSVIARADSWQDCLIACGMAAMGGGQAVYLETGDTSETSDYVLSSLTTSDKVYVLGDEDTYGEEMWTRITEVMGKTASSLPVSDLDDAEGLSLSVYANMLSLSQNNDYDYAWGDVAIVCSSTQSLASTAIAQYAYLGAYPVFMTASDGSLSAEALGYLQSGGFTKVVVAGPESYVPASTVAAIQAAGLTVERVAAASSAYEASLEVAELVADEFGGANADYLVAASAADPAYVCAAAQLAAQRGGMVVPVASSADVKQAVAYADEAVGRQMTAVVLVGDFTAVEEALAAAGSSTAAELFTSLWSSTESTAIAAGDTIEHGGVLYEVTGAGSVSYVGFAEEALEALEWGAFECDGTTYDPGELTSEVVTGNTTLRYVSAELTSVPAGMFAGCTALESVDITATSIGASAFAGCTALTGITTAATSIGASAFSGCTALASAKLTASGLKTIPASCFSGCSKLTTVTIASTALTGVGSKAFYGCKKLKSVSLKSAKLTSIGASAFAGCSAMTKAAVSSKKLKTIGASAFSGCSKLATVTLASTALTSVGSKAFYSCKKLKSLNLKSAKLKTIGVSAFQGCSAMTKLTVSSTALTKVGAKALYGCKKLKTLTLKTKKLKTVGKSALKGTTKSLTVKVPKAKVKKYTKLLQKRGLNKKAKVKAA